MTNRQKSLLIRLCKDAKDKEELLKDVEVYGLGCSKSTINKYWRNWGVNGRLRSDKEIADE